MSALAQNKNLVLSQINDENGLSDNHIKCVFKDKRGFIWIGTSDGLNLMDGSVIKVFRHQDDSNSISGNYVNCITEDDSENIYLGTDKGLNIYNYVAKKFEHYAMPASGYDASSFINSIIIDKKNTWCATTGGLFFFNRRDKKFTPFFNISGNPAIDRYTNKINYAMLGSDKKLWLCTFDGLWWFDTEYKKYHHEISKDNDQNYDGLINCVFEDHLHRIWAGTWNRGLKELTKNGAVISYTKKNDIHNILCINESVDKNGKGILWLNGNLNAFDPNEKKFFQFTKPFLLNESPDVTSVYRSGDRWMWLATGKGLFVYDPEKQLFKNRFFTQELSPQGVSLSEVNDLLLVGANGNEFLKAYNNDLQTVHDYASILYNKRIDVSALSINIQNANNWWLCTSDGIIHYNPFTKNVKWYTHNSRDSNSIPGNFIPEIFIDSKKQIWIFPWREGIWTLDSVTGRCRRLLDGFIPEGGQTKRLLISDAKEDAAGNIWMADEDEGIILYESKTGIFSKPFKKEMGERVSVYKILNKNSFFYSFNNSTIYKWNPLNKKLQEIKLPYEFRKQIFDMVCDKTGTWWIATANGLILFNETVNTFKKISTSNGLVSNDMNGTLFCKQNGDIVFAAANYITEFNPAGVVSLFSKSQGILVTDVLANGHSVNRDNKSAIVLNYDKNNVEIKWAFPDFTNPFRNQYYCMLQGIDAGWQYKGNSGDVQYANLSPGKYRLLVKASTSNGVAADNIVNIDFVIKPPFWKTAWFISLLILLAAFIIYLLTVKRIRSIRKKAALQQQMAELELKALRAQMNPHFIFNSLSSIQESILNNKTDAAAEYLGKFSKLLRMVLENSGQKNISLKTEIDYLKLYLELESFRFENFEFTIQISNDPDLEFIRIPPMIIQPYVENAIKHGLSHKAGEKKLSIHFYQQMDELKASVTDNGIGRKSSHEMNARNQGHHSMGMQITGQRLSLLNNKMGAVVIEDITDEDGRPAGTKVTLTFPKEINLK